MNHQAHIFLCLITKYHLRGPERMFDDVPSNVDREKVWRFSRIWMPFQERKNVGNLMVHVSKLIHGGGGGVL